VLFTSSINTSRLDWLSCVVYFPLCSVTILISVFHPYLQMVCSFHINNILLLWLDSFRSFLAPLNSGLLISLGDPKGIFEVEVWEVLLIMRPWICHGVGILKTWFSFLLKNFVLLHTVPMIRVNSVVKLADLLYDSLCSILENLFGFERLLHHWSGVNCCRSP